MKVREKHLTTNNDLSSTTVKFKDVMGDHPDLEELDHVWPEGAKSRSSLEGWCEAEGVPGPSGTQLGHRRRVGHEQPGFGLVNKPVAANSAEGKNQVGQ